MTDAPEIQVSVWAPVGGGLWGVVGDLPYTQVEFEPRHQDVGVWSATMPYNPGVSEVVQPGRLVTTRFRGTVWTWTIAPRSINTSDDGLLIRTIGGFDALAMIGWPLAWPDPTVGLDAQPVQRVYTGPAETVIRSMVIENLRTRYGLPFVANGSNGRGSNRVARVRFPNLLEAVLRQAKAGGIGVRFGLSPATPSATRARLLLDFYTPRDLTTRVKLSAADGSLASWELTEYPPSATYAIVGGSGEGAGQYLHAVTTPESVAAAAVWGGHREVYVDGPDTFDNTTLDDAGEQAIGEGAAVTTLTMEAREPAGTKAFTTFTVGDLVTGVPAPGVSIPDVVSAIHVTHGDAGYVEVAPIFGDPDVGDPEAMTAQLIRALRRDVQAMSINRKRGAT